MKSSGKGGKPGEKADPVGATLKKTVIAAAAFLSLLICGCSDNQDVRLAIKKYAKDGRVDPAKVFGDRYKVVSFDLRDAWARNKTTKTGYFKAIEGYSRAIALDPGNVEAYKKRAFVYGANGDYNKAIADLSGVLALNPKDAYAYYGRGLVYSQKGGYDKAIADFSSVIKL
jgi:tetratricopeptide (TPR) repeat protein